jgi:ABC-type multidrug transport system ATPase subunit
VPDRSGLRENHSAIRTEGLTKRYGTTLALDGLDLTVRAREVDG